MVGGRGSRIATSLPGAMERIGRLMRQVGDRREGQVRVSPVATISTDSAPSNATLTAIRRHLPAFVREALPFSGVKILASDLDFDSELMWRTLDVYHLELRKQALELLANDPLLAIKHTLGRSIDEQRDITVKQMMVYARAKFYRFQDMFE